MKIIILGGFLGSGKTTVLMHFARHLVSVSQEDHKSKVVILENEIGENGVDDKLLRGSGFAVENLFSGCACCTISGELIDSVCKVERELDPEWLVVETTGIAYPKSIRENLAEALHKTCSIIILADAQRWSRLFVAMRPLITGQIEGADSVLINKTDLVNEDIIHSIESDIHGINPHAAIYPVCGLSDDNQTVFEKLLEASHE